MGTPIIPPFQRFAAKIKINLITGCWEWQGYRNAQGYGQFRLYPKVISAHRFAWICLVGAIPEGTELDHFLVSQKKCSECCCNPEHLRIATRQENNNNRRKSLAVTGLCWKGLHRMVDGNIHKHSDGGDRCLACKKINDQTYRDAHKESSKEYNQAYHAANRETQNKKNAIRQSMNRIARNKYKREWEAKRRNARNEVLE